MRRLLIIIAVVVVVVLVGMVYYVLDPAASTSLFPRCPFLEFTGFKCPGCGSQRAIHSLLHGDVSAAWHYNAMMLVSLPVLAVCLYGEAVRTSHPRRYARINSPRLIMLLLVAVLAWWVLRNMFGW